MTPWLLPGILLTGCPGSEDGSAVSSALPPVLRDTTGAEFEVVDGNPDDIRAVSDVALPPACGSEDAPSEFTFWLGKTGLAMICALDPEDGGPLDSSCRPLGCAEAADCWPGFSCVEGICWMHGKGRVDDSELVALCLADQQRTTTCPFGVANPSALSSVLESACDEGAGGLCTIPGSCK